MENNNEEKFRLPESVTIGGITYSVKETPELQQFIQNVAKVEKSKLYTQMENLRSQIASLNGVEVVGSNSNVDTNSIIEALKGSFISKDDLKDTLPNIIKEVVQPILSATEETHKNEIKEYREKLINENLDKCIPDLVKGDTKEELDASLAESIRLRGQYPAPVSQPVKENVVTKSNFTPTQQTQGQQTPQQKPDPMPTAPRRPSPEAEGPTNVKQMPMSEFAQRREALQQQLEAMYGQGQL